MRTNPEPSVLWREGMFLCPQHMQAFSREVTSRIQRQGSAGSPGAYGFLRLEIDEAALARDVFRLIAAELLFADGTWMIFPEDATVEQRSFGEFFTESQLPVYLGIPAQEPNVPQIANGSAGSDTQVTRYRIQNQSVFDENLRDSEQELEFRELQARLFFGEEDRSGYDCLPVAKLVRRGQPESVSAHSETFIPPVLAVEASQVLTREISAIAGQARGQARDLASRIPATAQLSSAAKGADLAGFLKLQAVNHCVSNLEQLAGLGSVHPFETYMWLVQTVGHLSVFGTDRVVAELPVYDQSNLEKCFTAALEAVRMLLGADVAVPYDRAPFKKDSQREGFFECEIPEDWLRLQPKFYLGIEMAKSADEATALVSGGVKLVSQHRLERVLQGVVPGIGLAYERVPPLAFPQRENLHFFRIETEGDSREHWLGVVEAMKAMLLSTLGAVCEVDYHLYVELRR